MMSLVWVLFVALLAFVAVSDIARYRIPNWASLALIALFAGVLMWRHVGTEWPWHLAAFVLALVVGITFFAFRQVGAGDAKLFAVIALWAGFGALVPLLFWIGVAGLIELAILTIARRIAAGRSGPLPRVLSKRQGVPFGAGIALGAAIASFWFPSWLWVA
jgi:prepilin peptidase CpaA